MLKILLIIPIIAQILIAFNKKERTTAISLGMTICSQIQLFYIQINFDSTNLSFQYQDYIGPILLGIDGISLWYLWLIQILSPILILATVGKSNPQRAYKVGLNRLTAVLSVGHKKQNYILFSIILLSNLVFMILDLLLFYITFELILVPMYLIIFYFVYHDIELQL